MTEDVVPSHLESREPDRDPSIWSIRVNPPEPSAHSKSGLEFHGFNLECSGILRGTTIKEDRMAKYHLGQKQGDAFVSLCGLSARAVYRVIDTNIGLTYEGVPKMRIQRMIPGSGQPPFRDRGEDQICTFCLKRYRNPPKTRKKKFVVYKDPHEGLKATQEKLKEWQNKMIAAANRVKKYQNKLEYYYERIEKENVKLRERLEERNKGVRKSRRIQLED